MEFTKTIFDFKNAKGNILAYVYVFFEDIIKIECKILKGKDGTIFVSLPTRKDYNTEKYINTVNIIDKRIYKHFQETTILAYKRRIAEMAERMPKEVE